MSMMTRCPACGTGFRIHHEQLEARQGQVRCGHCAVVFDANLHLSPLPDTTPPPPAPTPDPDDVPASAPGVLDEQALSFDTAEEAGITVGDTDAAGGATDETNDETNDERAGADHGTAADTDAAAHDDTPQAASVWRRPSAAGAPMPSDGPAIQAATSLLPEAPLEDFDFALRPPRNRAANFAANLLLALLVLGLLGQALYFFRVDVVKALPALRAPFETLCARVGCRIPYPQEATRISIEASDLQALPDARDVLVLSVVLRNRAAWPQAYPALELTLTDAGDRPVARRVLAPRDYLPDAPDPLPAFRAGDEAQLKLHIDAAGLAASGYRLYLFYP